MNKHYHIEISPAAQRQIKKLDKAIRNELIKVLEKLAIQPRPTGVSKLTGYEDLYRVRIKDHRIIYKIDGSVLYLLILKVGNRKDVYRSLTH